MKRSNQFPTKVKLKTTVASLGTLTYTFPLTGETKAVQGCIGVRYSHINEVMTNMIQHGYKKDCFHKPVYHENHLLLKTIV